MSRLLRLLRILSIGLRYGLYVLVPRLEHSRLIALFAQRPSIPSS